MARRTLVLFGMGILGAAVYASAEWSPGSSEAGRGPGPAPESPVASAVAHLAVLAAGGVAGVVVYLAVKAGIALSLVGEVTPQIRFSVAVVLAFSGGFGTIHLRRALRRRS